MYWTTKPFEKSKLKYSARTQIVHKFATATHTDFINAYLYHLSFSIFSLSTSINSMNGTQALLFMLFIEVQASGGPLTYQFFSNGSLGALNQASLHAPLISRRPRAHSSAQIHPTHFKNTPSHSDREVLWWIMRRDDDDDDWRATRN